MFTCSLPGKGTHAARLLFSLVFFLMAALVGPLLTSASLAQNHDSLDVAIGPMQKTKRFQQEFYSATVQNGTPPYRFFWIVYGPTGVAVPGAEKSGTAKTLVHDFYYTLPKTGGPYTISLTVRDSKDDYGTGKRTFTVGGGGKTGGGGGGKPKVSDLTPIIDGPNYVETGETFTVVLNTQGTGVGKVEWQWIAPKASTKKGFRLAVAKPGETNFTAQVWDEASPKITVSHKVRIVEPMAVSLNGSGVNRLGPREFQITQSKRFTVVATPRGGVGRNYRVKWGSRPEGRTYTGNAKSVGTGKITLSVWDEGSHKTTPKTYVITFRSANTTPADSDDVAGWWLYMRKAGEGVPVIINPRSSDKHYTGAYFPGMTVKKLLRGTAEGGTLVSNLQLYPRGPRTFYYTYKYNNNADRGDGTMTLSGNRMSGPWTSTEGNGSGNWYWVRPSAAELTKLRAHFGRG